MYSADNMVNIYACMATTKTSIRLIKTAKKTEAGDIQAVFAININEIKLNTIIWPAVMFANKRIISDIGLIKIPINSIGAKNNFIGTGTPGIQKICFQ